MPEWRGRTPGAAGDVVIVISYPQYAAAELERCAPTIVFVDDGNRITREHLRVETH